jgi:hypothetical protein
MKTFVTDISASTGKNYLIVALAWWLVPCLPFPGLLHIYFLFTLWLWIFHVCRSKNFCNRYLSFYLKQDVARYVVLRIPPLVHLCQICIYLNTHYQKMEAEISVTKVFITANMTVYAQHFLHFNGNSSKLGILAFYHIQISILLSQFDLDHIWKSYCPFWLRIIHVIFNIKYYTPTHREVVLRIPPLVHL